MRERFERGLVRLGLRLQDQAIEEELLYQKELLRWNKRINLTSIRDVGEAQEKHLLDSLLLLNHVVGGDVLLDVGSGGGLPGIPVAIAERGLQLVSVDSVGKKINFQKHIKRKLQLDNVQVEHCRVEELESRGFSRESFDVVVTRAFSSLETIFNVTAGWVAPGGKMIAMKGAEAADEMTQLEVHLNDYGFSDLKIFHYQLPFSRAERNIIIARKDLSHQQ